MPAAVNVEPAQATAPLPHDWLERHGDWLYAYAIQRIRRREVAEDLVQDTLLAGIKAWHGFQDRSQIRTWLTGIMRNKVTDHLRLRYQQLQSNQTMPEEAESFDHRGRWKTSLTQWRGDPSQLAETKEFRQVLDSCVSKLPLPMAHLFLSRANNDASTDELCQQLQITPENAWTLLHRARLRLRKCLTANWFANPD